MRARSFFLSTLKEAPADADIVSQQFMIRAGMIKKLAAGVYTYMPLGLRTIRKIEKIIREEMDRAGAVELLMPIVQPAELWQESGRWEKYGPELLRIKDRHGRDFVIQPTSEEVVTDIARQEIKSWRQLPVNFYHIQTKFRDERRPRFGVMRGREFTMKDAYSFDRDEAGASRSYDIMFDAYQKIFRRLGLMFRAVRADTGAIGGSRSHEFQVIADTGEDLIAYAPESDYAANIELAEAFSVLSGREEAKETMEKRATPGKEKCELVAEYLGIDLLRCVKSVVLAADRTDEKGDPLPAKIVLVLLRADHELNEVKAGHLPELRRRNRRDLRLEAGLPRSRRRLRRRGGVRRPHGRRHERLLLRRQRRGLPPHGRQLRARSPRPPGRRPSQRRRRRPLARRQGHAQAAARH